MTTHESVPELKVPSRDCVSESSEKSFKTSEQRRQYQREYYKIRQQQLLKQELEVSVSKKNKSGGDLISSAFLETQPVASPLARLQPVPGQRKPICLCF